MNNFTIIALPFVVLAIGYVVFRAAKPAFLMLKNEPVLKHILWGVGGALILGFFGSMGGRMIGIIQMTELEFFFADGETYYQTAGQWIGIFSGFFIGYSLGYRSDKKRELERKDPSTSHQ